MGRLAQILKFTGINLLIAFLILFLVEGLASFTYALLEIKRSVPAAERVHTEYDPELGWVNLPEVRVENMYGPGVYLQTNAQRFRNGRDFTRDVPDGRSRLICSGDSFTLGFGVDNDHTWCERLASLAENLETVNMGQGGYGVDQAYLWYMRDGVELEHQLHLFAFVTDDFRRMYYDTFVGYGKPLLAIEGDSLVLKNRPVPKTSYVFPWIARARPVVADLNAVRLAYGVADRLGLRSANTEQMRRTAEVREVVSRIFQNLDRTNQQKGSRLILVYLPSMSDFLGGGETDEWRAFVRDAASSHDITYLDIVEEMRRLSPQQFGTLFGPHAHYTEGGNQIVAELIFSLLSAQVDELPPHEATLRGTSQTASGIYG